MVIHCGVFLSFHRSLPSVRRVHTIPGHEIEGYQSSRRWTPLLRNGLGNALYAEKDTDRIALSLGTIAGTNACAWMTLVLYMYIPRLRSPTSHAATVIVLVLSRTLVAC